MSGEQFMDWRVQGIIVRNSRVGERLTPEQADLIMLKMEQKGMRGRFDSHRGVVVLNSGCLDDLIQLWQEAGSYAKQVNKRNALKAERQAREEAIDLKISTELSESPATHWIEETFGRDTMNDYNKLMLSRFLTGVSQKFEGLPNWKWRDGLERLSAIAADGKIDFARIRQEYSKADSACKNP